MDVVTLGMAKADAKKNYTLDQPGYDIFILAGQSNMAGTSAPALSNAAVTDAATPRISQWKTHGTTGIQPATDPLDMYDLPPLPQGMGPGLQFARWYASRRPNSKRKVLLVPTAKGGSALSGTSSPVGFSWKVGRTGVTNLYDNMVTQALAAKAAADAIPGTVNRFTGFLWVQGEADGDSGITGSVYRTDFDAMINQVRTDLNTPNLPIVIGTMVPEFLSSGTRAAIDAAQRNTPYRISNTTIAVGPTNSNIGDNNHYNTAGQRAFGKTFADAYDALMQGIISGANDYVPATATYLTVQPASSTSLKAAWVAATNADTYLVEYRLTGGSTWTTAATVSTTTTTITGLTAGQSYDVQVTTRNIAGASAAPSTIVAGTPATLPTPVVTDTFTRADSTTVVGTADTGQTWASSVGTWGISSNAIYNPSAVDGDRALINAGITDMAVKTTITAGQGTGALAWGVIARASDANNYYRVDFGNVLSAAKLFKVVGGTATQLGTTYTYGPPVSNGDTIGLTVKGSTITVYLRDVAIITVTDTSLTTGTNAGLRNGSSSSSAAVIRYDNFTVSAS